MVLSLRNQFFGVNCFVFKHNFIIYVFDKLYLAYIRFKDLCDVGMCFELVGEVINIKTQGPFNV